MLFFACMYSVDFIPTLDGTIRPTLIIFSVYGGKYSTGSYSRVRYKFMCYVLYMLWLVCVGSHIFIRSSAGQYSRLPWMGLRSFFPVYGRWYNRSLLCLTFTFVYFSVGFIWKNGSNVVSSLLVRAILPFVFNFSRKLVGLKVCCSFLFHVFYSWLLWF